MKRKIISAFLALMLCLSLAAAVCAASNDAFLLDEAGLLSRSEASELNAKLQDISQKHNAQVVICTVSSVSGDVDDYIEHIYDTMGFGYGVSHDGVLLLVSMSPREYRILSNGFVADAIDYEEIDKIGEKIVSDLSDGDYADAFETFAEQCDYYINGHLNGFPFDFGMWIAIALGIGIVVGLVVVFILKSQLKSVRNQNHADVYVKDGSMQLTARSDLFLYRNVIRTRRETNKSSGSGSSRRVGGGSF